LLSACEELEGKQDESLRVELGVVQSLSGTASIYGNSVLQGIELAVAEINDTDEGVDLTVTLIDDEGQVETGVDAFETLTSRNVTAIIGPTLSNVALEAMPVAQSAGVPVLGATTTAQGIIENGDYVFRVALTEAVVVPATLARVHEDVPITGAVMVFDSSDAFSRSSADAMRTGIAEIAATIVAEVDVATTDIATMFADLHAKAFEAFLVTPLVEKSSTIVRALRADGFSQAIIGGNSFNTPGIAAEAGTAVEGAYVGAAWNPGVDTAAGQAFVKAFTDKYGSAPDLFAAQGYSSVYLLFDAVQRAESVDRAAVRDALAATKDLSTPLGRLTMSPIREAEHAPVAQRFENGKLVVLP
jgi:branched-chain amino acid transport system substrate-binding protein